MIALLGLVNLRTLRLCTTVIIKIATQSDNREYIPYVKLSGLL